MSGILASLISEAEVALVAATAKTVLQLIAPTNQRLTVKGFSVTFDGTTSTNEAVICELLRQTTAGTMTAQTPKMLCAGSETLQATGGRNASAEPTAGDILKPYNIHPQSGLIIMFPPDQVMTIPGGGRLGMRLTAPDAVNCLPEFIYDE